MKHKYRLLIRLFHIAYVDVEAVSPEEAEKIALAHKTYDDGRYEVIHILKLEAKP